MTMYEQYLNNNNEPMHDDLKLNYDSRSGSSRKKFGRSFDSENQI